MTPTLSHRQQPGLPALLRTGLLTLSSLVLFSACSSTPPAAEPADPYAAHAAATLRTSPNDDRDYRLATLPNRLRVLLISDPDADKAAASLVVARGSFHEPPEYAGLAHFLEHMLFIGTEKYPQVDDYQQFIGTHGGMANAYTALDHTNYFFDIKPEQFQPAMDRFAQFFVSPLFDAAYVDREKNAVHSEYQLQTKDAGWRGYAVSKLTLNPEHPGSRFTIGSLDTLGDGVRDALVDWFAKNYSADQMFLVAMSNEPLDALESWISPMFAAIPDRDIGQAAAMPPAYREEDLPATLVRETLKDRYSVEYQFQVPSLRPHFDAKPALYITNLLGHEGPGSLHQWLKAQGWIQSLAARADEFDPQTGLISVALELTPAGADQVPQITGALFEYIDLIRAAGADPALFAEQAALLDLSFQFQESVTPSRLVTALGPRFLELPAGHVIDAPYRMERFDAALISDYLSYLTPDNVLVDIAGPEQDTDAVEPWFQVPYRLARDTVAVAQAPVGDSLSLPPPNPFVPDNTKLVNGAVDAAPSRAVERPGIELWQAIDTSFGTPKANVYLTLGIPGGLTTAQDLVLGRLYSSLVTDALSEFSYPAYLAGLSYQLSASASGFELRLAGYDDKQVRLLETVLETFATLTPAADRFEIYRDQLERNLNNFRTERPYAQTLTALGNLVQSASFPPATLANVAASVSLEDLNAWIQSHRAGLTVRGLLHGNIRSARAGAIADVLAAQLKPEPHPVYQPLVFGPDSAARLAVTVDHPDASMILYLQDEEATIPARARSALATHLVRQAYFTELRTEDQLGYVVGVSNRTYQDRGGIAFIVQSPVADPRTLVERTYRFLDEQINVVREMTPEAFAAYQSGLVADLLESPKNLGERSAQFWSDLRLERLSFDTRQALASAVMAIDQTSAVATLKSMRAELPERQVVVYNLGKFDRAPTIGTAISDFDALNPQAARDSTRAPQG
ncbi:MAG: insulinase family protein [Pseudomonadota bacterium]